MSRRLYVFNGGFLYQRRVRRILQLSGYRIVVGRPTDKDLIGVWGQSATAHRGEAMVARTGASIVRIEDAWLRSLFPGRRRGSEPLGLLIDHKGVHFDPKAPSDLEDLLQSHPLDDGALLARARGAMARMAEAHLTKYTAIDPDLPVPAPGYVLVIDQTRGDASVTASGADINRFREMLYWAQENHPGMRVIIKTHPETVQGFRQGHFDTEDGNDRVSLLTEPMSSWKLLEGAVAVYTVSSQLGFEAILAGHRPHVYGHPFYAGWGLTEDAFPVPRRGRTLTRAQLCAAALLLYPTWYDPNRDRLCSFEDTAEALAAETRAWREDHRGYVASGMRLWKRRHLQQGFGRYKKIRFLDDPAAARNTAIKTGRKQTVWASKIRTTSDWDGALRMEDGFLRSRGLGAELVPPLSLVLDDLGIYYDPSRPSRLEQLIAQRAVLRPDQENRARQLVRALTGFGISKYNLGTPSTELPQGHRILIPGQVADDASIRLGTSEVTTNAALLKAARKANPKAILIYKPHPDVEAGLRDGAIDAGDADLVLRGIDPASLLPQINEIWTMTSGLGFEALLHDVPVTTLGAPFYAGWGLSRDLGRVPARRAVKVSMFGLVHATLIDYPRYFDPQTNRPCPVEIAVERLAKGAGGRRPASLRALAKLQGIFASYAYLWR